MHHANLLIGDVSWARSLIPLSDRTPGPDVRTYPFERMAIADVRALIYETILAPVGRTERIFILECTTINPEAQNALLKLFEEPNPKIRFYLIIPNASLLLPTLRSRLHVLGEEQRTEVESHITTEFIHAPYAERLRLIELHTKQKDDAWVEEIVRGIEHLAHQKHRRELLEDILFVRTYLDTPGASKKMLLEHLSLSLS